MTEIADTQDTFSDVNDVVDTLIGETARLGAELAAAAEEGLSSDRLWDLGNRVLKLATEVRAAEAKGLIPGSSTVVEPEIEVIPTRLDETEKNAGLRTADQIADWLMKAFPGEFFSAGDVEDVALQDEMIRPLRGMYSIYAAKRIRAKVADRYKL